MSIEATRLDHRDLNEVLDIEPTSGDVPELRWDTVTVRAGLATATGTRPFTVSAKYGLALAAVAGAPVRVPDEVMDRLAVAVPGEDMLAPFLPPADGRAGLVLRIISSGQSTPPQAASPDPREDPANHIASATGTGAWTQYEVTAQIPADANLIRFGVFLNGGGQLEFRHPALAPHPPGCRQS